MSGDARSWKMWCSPKGFAHLKMRSSATVFTTKSRRKKGGNPRSAKFAMLYKVNICNAKTFKLLATMTMLLDVYQLLAALEKSSVWLHNSTRSRIMSTSLKPSCEENYNQGTVTTETCLYPPTGLRWRCPQRAQVCTVIIWNATCHSGVAYHHQRFPSTRRVLNSSTRGLKEYMESNHWWTPHTSWRTHREFCPSMCRPPSHSTLFENVYSTHSTRLTSAKAPKRDNVDAWKPNRKINLISFANFHI